MAILADPNIGYKHAQKQMKLIMVGESEMELTSKDCQNQ